MSKRILYLVQPAPVEPLDDLWQHETLLPNTRTGRRLWVLVAAGTLLAVTIMPIFVHLVLLALFGFAHVLMELRYVDGRFAARLGTVALKGMAMLIANIVIVRFMVGRGYMSAMLGMGSEIALGAGLIALAVAISSPRSILTAVLTVMLALLVTALAIMTPIHAIVIIAVLHNLTPLVFLAEVLPAAEARLIMLMLALPFLVVPLVIASGLPQALLSTVMAVDATWVPSAMRPFSRHLSAFLPPEAINTAWAVQAFAAAVFAQAMHYLAVIVVLPRLAMARALTGTTLIAWPRGHALLMTVGGLSMVLGLYFIVDYAQTHIIYGMVAAVHTWVEISLFMLAVGGGLKLSSAQL